MATVPPTTVATKCVVSVPVAASALAIALGLHTTAGRERVEVLACQVGDTSTSDVA